MTDLMSLHPAQLTSVAPTSSSAKTIDASPSNGFATKRMTAEMIPTNPKKSAARHQRSSQENAHSSTFLARMRLISAFLYINSAMESHIVQEVPTKEADAPEIFVLPTELDVPTNATSLPMALFALAHTERHQSTTLAVLH